MQSLGKMRHVVRIERRSTTQDTAGEPLLEWVFVAQRRAALEAAPGSEVWSSTQRQGRVPTIFKLRYDDGILPAMRLLFNSKVYNIISAVDLTGLREELTVTTEELVEAVP